MSSNMSYHLWQYSCCLRFQEGIKGSYAPKWKWLKHDHFPFHLFPLSGNSCKVELYSIPFMPTACQMISSLVVSTAANSNQNWGSWPGFDFELVNAIKIDRHTAWLKLEIISAVEFDVCFGSLYWLNSPNESGLFVILYCGEMAWEPSWHFECWLSCCTDDGAFSSLPGRGGCCRLTFWIIEGLPFSSGPLFLNSPFCDVWENTELWLMNRAEPMVGEPLQIWIRAPEQELDLQSALLSGNQWRDYVQHSEVEIRLFCVGI